MPSFVVVVKCHQLAKQKDSTLLVSSKKESLTFMKYSDQHRICCDLRSFFGDVRVLDGGVQCYTDPARTGDQTGTVWSVPDDPCLLNIADVADSILACHKAKVRFTRA